MKKKVLIILSVFLFAIIVVLGYTAIDNFLYKANNPFKDIDYTQSTLYKNSMLIEECDTNIMTYGVTISDFKYVSNDKITTINSISEVKNDHDYNVLIIDDVINEVSMSDEDYNKIKDIIENDGDLFVIYFGDKKISKFYEYNLLTTAPRADGIGVYFGPMKNNSVLMLGDNLQGHEKIELENRIVELIGGSYIKPILEGYYSYKTVENQ